MTVAAEYRHHNRTNRASFDPRDQVSRATPATTPSPSRITDGAIRTREDVMTFVNASVPLNSRRDAFSLRLRRLQPACCANSAGFYRRALDARNWPQIYPLGFLPVIEPTVVDASGTAASAASVKKWSYDASGGFGRNSFAFTIGDTLNVSLGPPVHRRTRREFDAGTLELESVRRQHRRQPRVPTCRGFAGPLNVAFGAGVSPRELPDPRRRAGLLRRRRPAEPVRRPCGNRCAGLPGVPAVERGDESRNSVAGYVDVEGDLISWLRIGVAGRTEHYSDFGGTLDGKLTARVQPDSRFVMRGSISTGFRAPSLAQSFFSSTATNFLNLGQGLVPVESLTLPVRLGAGAGARRRSRSSRRTPCTRAPASSSRRSAAVDHDRLLPHRHRRSHRPLRATSRRRRSRSLLAPFGANSARFFTNAIDTRTNGVDVTASYRVRARARPATCGCAPATTTRAPKIVGSIATPPQLAGFASVLFDRIERRRIECGQPSDSVRLGGNWRRNRLGARPRRRPVRRVLQLHAEPGRRSGVPRRSG